MRKNLSGLLLLGVLVSCLLVLPSRSESPKRFPHAKHLESGAECATCHPAAESENLKTSLLPTTEVCKGCHEQSDLDLWGWSTIPARTSPFRNYSHKAHLGLGKQCEDCHGAMLRGTASIDGKGQPGHALCFQCHDGARAGNDCETCHSNLREGRLDGFQRDPSLFKPLDHHPGFLHDHQFALRLDGKRCTDCHREADFCSTCHQGDNVDVMVHERNWLNTHPVAARKNLHDCTSCHEMGTFCTECHAASGIAPGDHTPAWKTNGKIHGPAGRRDITLCASCHEQQAQGISCGRSPACHQDDGIQGNQPNRNIHPSGFKDEVGAGPWMDSDDVGCFACHNPGTRVAGTGFCGYCHGAK